MTWSAGQLCAVSYSGALSHYTFPVVSTMVRPQLTDLDQRFETIDHYLYLK